MPKLSILHISDSHIGNTFPYESVEEIAIRTAEDIADNSPKIDCVVVTGDIFDGHSSYNIDEAVLFFQTLQNRLNKKIDGTHLKEEDFIFVPGNHDVIRTENGPNYENYINFLKKFHSEDYFNNSYNNKYLYSIRIFEDSVPKSSDKSGVTSLHKIYNFAIM